MTLSQYRYLCSIVSACALIACVASKPTAFKRTSVPIQTPHRSLTEQQNQPAAGTARPALNSDEGMWLLNQFPAKQLEQRHGFAPDESWLRHVQLAALRIAGGCSGGFVSEHGLMLTNHHCASQCLQQLSAAHRDYMTTGFSAASEKEETKCPGMEVNQLLSIADVTGEVVRATEGRVGAEFRDALQGVQSRIESACAPSEDFRCDVVSLYHGGLYHLYRYRRFQDVRLVFAPEASVAFFGGDPDNFMFPRYDLDIAFLRVYEGGRPLPSPEFFRWSPNGAAPGDLTFIAGHPWHTSRELTVAQLVSLRDHVLPERLLQLAEARGVLTEYRQRGPEQKRTATNLLFGIENSLKALKGRVTALRDPRLFGAKVATEHEFRARVDASPALKAATSGAWEAIAQAEARFQSFRTEYRMLEQGQGFWSELFDNARRLVRLAEESGKPNNTRLREYADAQRPTLLQQLLSQHVIYDDLEVLTLAFSLTKLREELGADSEIVAGVLGTASPPQVARQLVRGTRLKDPTFRRELLEGGAARINSSADPMVALARRLDPIAREVRKRFEDEVEAVIRKNSELIARARFAVYGTTTYPDATSTLRLSFGQVLGYQEHGKQIEPFTTFGRAFERATGSEPFALPSSWLAAKGNMDSSKPLNFCATNDIIGGNSGSPVLDRAARIVGVVFDGNIHSLGGDYFYAPDNNRAVAVHSTAILEALEKIYGTHRVLAELRPAH